MPVAAAGIHPVDRTGGGDDFRESRLTLRLSDLATERKTSSTDRLGDGETEKKEKIRPGDFEIERQCEMLEPSSSIVLTSSTRANFFA